MPGDEQVSLADASQTILLKQYLKQYFVKDSVIQLQFFAQIPS